MKTINRLFLTLVLVLLVIFYFVFSLVASLFTIPIDVYNNAKEDFKDIWIRKTYK